MSSSDVTEDVVRRAFPQLADAALRAAVCRHGRLVAVPAGTTLLNPGPFGRIVPLVVTGRVQVLREAEDGRQLLLYYLRAGQTCAVSLRLADAAQTLSVRAVAAEASELITLPAHVVGPWPHEFAAWSRFVLQTYQLRFAEVLRTLESVAFQPLDQRLVQHLAAHADAAGLVATTHQGIADALRTSREVVSRLLKTLERAGAVRLHRHRIQVLALPPHPARPRG